MTRFLIVRLGALGDVVHGIPVAAALRAHFPSAAIDWLVSPPYVELLDLVDGLDRRIPVDPRRRSRGAHGQPRLRDVIRDLRAQRYDAAFDLQGLLKSALIARSAGASVTVGFSRGHAREALATAFYTHAIDPGDATHVVYKNLELLKGVHVDDRRVRFPLRVQETPTSDAVFERWPRRQFVLINPGAAWPNKRWPADRFGALASAIARSRGWRSLVLWGPGEESLAAAVVAASAGSAEVAPATSIADMVAIARGARLMVAGDTGPLHIGGAVGTPLVSLFGPTRAERNGPWGLYDMAVSRTDRCRCLYKRTCSQASACIDDISVADVMQAVEQRVAAGG